jgi:L-ascorbate metabolism protein UlaG (beta-lactamase superfamily)
VDLQFHGANCISLSVKGRKIILDDNLAELGAKSITKSEDIALFTNGKNKTPAELFFDGPGEYEVSDVSVTGISARAHMDEEGKTNATMFKLIAGDQNILVTGHIYPDLSEAQLEKIGVIDILIVPVGGNGYTVDPVGAVKLIRAIEPKIVIPTHYADKAFNYPVPQQDLENALKEMTMEPKETVSKLRLKATELSDVTQLILLEKS